MSHGNEEISFTNAYGKKLYVAYMRVDDEGLCEADHPGNPWEARGWIGLDPGETEYRANDSGNQWFAYYAEAVGGAKWSGNILVQVWQTKFVNCWGLIDSSDDWRYVGMRVLDTVKYSGVRFV